VAEGDLVIGHGAFGLGLRGTGEGGGGGSDAVNALGVVGMGRGIVDGEGFGRLDVEGPPERGGGARPRTIIGSDTFTAKGTLKRDLVMRVVGMHRVELMYCYERALARTPGLAGRLTLRVLIDAAGKATVSVTANTLKSEAVEQCVVQRAPRWLFPEAAGPTDATFTVEFTP
jgi:hypothetical protein